MDDDDDVCTFTNKVTGKRCSKQCLDGKKYCKDHNQYVKRVQIKQEQTKTVTKTTKTTFKHVEEDTDDDSEEEPKNTQIVKYNENNIDPIVKQAEQKLDAKITQYNGFTKTHPMIGITWSDTRNSWVIQFKNIHTSKKELTGAVEIIKKSMETNCYKNAPEMGKIIAVEKIEYKGKSMVLYGNIEESYFDIRHIISMLDLSLSKANSKYDTFKSKIVARTFVKNKFDGYFVREFVDEKTVYEIVLSSTSKFSKSFKKDVSEILVQLRKSGQLEVAKTGLKLKKNSQNNQEIVKLIEPPINEPRTINDQEYIEYVKRLVREGQNIALSKFHKKHALYMFAMTHNKAPNKILCKIGYTENIIQRIQDLIKTYQCHIYLVRLKLIRGETAEKEFHVLLKKTHPELVFELGTGFKDFKEVYVFDEKLVAEFDGLEEYGVPNIQENVPVAQHVVNYIKDQFRVLIYYLEVENKGLIKSFIPQIQNFSEPCIKFIENLVTLHCNQYCTEMTGYYAVEQEREKSHQEELKKSQEEYKLRQEESKERQLQLQIQLVKETKSHKTDHDK